jgi:apolipoprotein N-acyltransferase
LVFWVLSIPPFEFAEAAYIAFVPLMLWLKARPSWRLSFIVSWIAGTIAWFAILIWLRHVTWAGTFIIAAVFGFFFAFWVLAARWLFSRSQDVTFALRLIFWAGLAGLWVLLEWSRTWFLYGFPWAPLSLSQWERPVVLQIAAWSGAYGVSFLLIFFNACVAHTLWVRATVRERKLWSGWFSPDLYAGLSVLFFCIVVFFKTLPDRAQVKPLFRAGVVQPYIIPELKWDMAHEIENMERLIRQTNFVGAMDGDLILWPEAATPWPIIGDMQMQSRVGQLADSLERPILMGNLAHDRLDKTWQNGVFIMEPKSGLRERYYVKRELVPFGEYVPAPFAKIVEKIVPLGGEFIAGTSPEILSIQLRSQEIQIGALVCYEDVFPALARSSVQAGAQVLFVTTNNAWYGEEGGAPQHAAHSVLRAVENRRPVMRCGNAGWSGWIDAYGTIREVLRDDRGSVYFCGGGTYTVAHDRNWMRRQSFYTRHGDWFVAACGGAVFFAVLFGLASQRKG